MAHLSDRQKAELVRQHLDGVPWTRIAAAQLGVLCLVEVRSAVRALIEPVGTWVRVRPSML